MLLRHLQEMNVALFFRRVHSSCTVRFPGAAVADLYSSPVIGSEPTVIRKSASVVPLPRCLQQTTAKSLSRSTSVQGVSVHTRELYLRQSLLFVSAPIVPCGIERLDGEWMKRFGWGRLLGWGGVGFGGRGVCAEIRLASTGAVRKEDRGRIYVPLHFRFSVLTDVHGCSRNISILPHIHFRDLISVCPERAL